MADPSNIKQDIFIVEPSNASAKILYLNQISNNKKAYNIHKLVHQYVRIYYLSKYSKYAEGLQINPIKSCESCRIDLDNGILCLLYSYYMYVYCRWSYRPWESVEGGGRVYEDLLLKFNSEYKIL